MTQHIDTLEITIKSGSGGAGAISFRREKYINKGGPDGGDGGNGGNVLIKGTNKLRSLLDLKKKIKYTAKNGQKGLPKKKHGAKGESITINVPLGTLIYDEKNVLIDDITDQNQEICIAKGGIGGQGNVKFATSVNRTPRYAQPGKPGIEKKIRLELKLIAQIGIIGLPSAGKSTLLKIVTSANAKIGDYPFTTLYPNLGTLSYDNQELIITDIPGLIKGSSQGLGLGNHFLRHIERTELLIHLIDPSNPEIDALNAFKIINKELKKSPYKTQKKPTIVVLSKIDMISTAECTTLINKFKQINITLLPISSHHHTGIEFLIKSIYLLYNQIKKSS